MLLTCLKDSEQLYGIFKKMPPQNKGLQDLPTLQKHEILEIEFAVKTHKLKDNSRKSLSPMTRKQE